VVQRHETRSSNSFPFQFIEFNNALWFTASKPDQGTELWKLGADGSVTQWTDINPGAASASPRDFFEFENALWFRADGDDGNELYKLSADGSVTQWSDIFPGPGSGNPSDGVVLA
jgi:ELWxxDGT repeat protein